VFLRADGMDLKGEDLLEPVRLAGRRVQAGPWPVDIRFHLAPGVTAIATQGQQSAALKLSNGTVWMFRCKGGRLEIAETLVLDGQGRARKSSQLIIHAPAGGAGLAVNWLFQRQGK
jgi:uncharacterized heparinase superfamily protein